MWNRLNLLYLSQWSAGNYFIDPEKLKGKLERNGIRT